MKAMENTEGTLFYGDKSTPQVPGVNIGFGITISTDNLNLLMLQLARCWDGPWVHDGITLLLSRAFDTARVMAESKEAA